MREPSISDTHRRDGVPLFRAADLFLCRSPLNPRAPGLPTGHAGEPRQREACAAVLASAGEDAELHEALLLASPSLASLVDRVREHGAEGITDARLRRASLAVLRYDVRRRTRPTPFGLFAGVAVGTFDSTAKAERGPAHRTRTHVDMQWLTRVGNRLEADAAVLSSLNVQAHQGLRVRGDRLVLAYPSTRGLPPRGDGPDRSTVSVRRTPLVAEAVAKARCPVPYGKLVGDLSAAFPEVAVERVRTLLAALVREELLITEVRPPLDGGDPLRHVLDVLDRAACGDGTSGETEELRRALHRLDNARHAYDALPVGAGAGRLRHLLDTARAAEPDDTPLHIDTRLDTELRLPHVVRSEVERAAEVMWRLSRPKLGLFALREYHRRFLDVYGADRLVPVLELLDEATGLGAPAGYGWPNSEAPEVPPEDARSVGRDRAMARLVARAQRAGRREVVLSDAELAEFVRGSADPADLPASCEVTVQVTAPGADALGEGEFRVFLSPSPGSHRAGSTFARFADLDTEWRARFSALHRDVPAHVAGAGPVDLAFRPRGGRAANLAHTVPGTGRRISVGVPDAVGVEELPIEEVGIGATLERMTAVHLPTGRELVPVLGNMVSAPAQAPNAVRLLWEIGLEGQRLWEPWNWGPLADAPFVPRVRHGRFVLASAVWRLDELRAAAEESGAGWEATLARWREWWQVPRLVLAVAADQRLTLDLDDAWHRELLRDQLCRNPELIAQEVPGEHEGWLESPFAGHATELVVPLTRRPDVPPRRGYAGRHQPERTVHGLGGNWIYLKLHGPARCQDALLRDHLPALVNLAGEKGADGWFFLRYTDPSGHHLRVRLHAEAADRLWGRVAPAVGALLGEWQRAGLVRSHTLAQYDPETERYGGPTAQHLAEQVFRYDSEAALELLRLAKEPENDHDVESLAAVSVASLAHAFGPPGPEDPLLAGDFGDDSAAAWLSMTGSRRDLPQEYRAGAGRWRRLVDPYAGFPALTGDGTGQRIREALLPRDEAVRRLAARVREASSTPRGRVVGSLLHMACNRLFGGDSAQEAKVLGIARGAVQDNLNRRRHHA
ncbi:lantibiotic dehydratase [Streptomyces xiaopingdaonensis]|uniref:lantibiotic dehydratase n=1 Tax=Streptomyces xiaopingdaonensis TaxID=1565415 RepID=UPI000306C152|nr:lantibiotic dehydratase [Streptomyces xiaopingdaonensis]